MSAVLEQATPEPRVLVTYDTHPDRYVHWRMAFDGAVATLSMDVNEEKGIKPGYRLKLNSYDLGVDIELYDALQRIRFEHPEVKCVVLTSARERMFCSGANIYMLGLSSHSWKVNFCKFTNETRNGIEDSSRHEGLKFLAAVNGTVAGGGYELALACDEILMIDDRSSTVSLPEVPLLGVLPGTGGLTRLTDKRKVRRDLADVFCSTSEGVRADRARQWKLVDHIAKPQQFAQAAAERAAELARHSNRPGAGTGVALPPLERTDRRGGLSLSPRGRRHRPQRAHGDHHRSLPAKHAAADPRADPRGGRELVAVGHGARAGRCHPPVADQRPRDRFVDPEDTRRHRCRAGRRCDVETACR